MGTFKQFAIYDPRIKKPLIRSVGTTKISEEEAEKIGQKWLQEKKKEIAEWRKQQIENKIEEIDKMPKYATDTSSEYSSSDEETTNLNVVKPFNVELPSNNTCSFLLLGSTRSGKTTFMKYIVKEKFKNHITACMTQSLHADVYKDLGKNIALCSSYQPQILNDMYQINKNTKNHYDFLTIIDDCPTTKNDKELLKALTIYRNSDISVIIANQELSLFNAISRSNINFVCLFKLNSDMAIEKCVKTYLRSYFPPGTSLPEMIKKYRELTDNHHFFFINNLTGEVCRTKISI